MSIPRELKCFERFDFLINYIALLPVCHPWGRPGTCPGAKGSGSEGQAPDPGIPRLCGEEIQINPGCFFFLWECRDPGARAGSREQGEMDALGRAGNEDCGGSLAPLDGSWEPVGRAATAKELR